MPFLPSQPCFPCTRDLNIDQLDSDKDGIGNACEECGLVLAEWMIYGSAAEGRVATVKPKGIGVRSGLWGDTNLVNIAPSGMPPALVEPFVFTRVIAEKEFELKDHLGNVRVVVSDMKLNGDPDNGSSGWAASPASGMPPFMADMRAYNNYYPFGMLQPGRHWSTEGYRYGFNGMEMDNEMHDEPTAGTSGVGSQYTTEFRMYDPRLGRWWSIDPVTKSSVSPYTVMSNSPIVRADPQGDDDYFSASGKYLGNDNEYFSGSEKSNKIRIVDEKKYNEEMANAFVSGFYKTAEEQNTTRINNVQNAFRALREQSQEVTSDPSEGATLQQMWKDSNPTAKEANKRKEQAAIIGLDLKNAKLVLLRQDDSRNTNTYSVVPGPEAKGKVQYVPGTNQTILYLGIIHTHPNPEGEGFERDATKHTMESADVRAVYSGGYNLYAIDPLGVDKWSPNHGSMPKAINDMFSRQNIFSGKSSVLKDAAKDYIKRQSE